jgi:prepilin-type processing-associated H-X9-DG protein
MLTIVVATLGLTASVLHTVADSTRDHLDRSDCAARLREIGLAAIMYADQHGEHFPDSFKPLLSEEDLWHYSFFCPRVPTPTVATTQQAELVVTTQSSYTYLGKGLTKDASADTVLAYEPLTDHGDGINVLFTDAHVEWLDAIDANALLGRVRAGEWPLHYPATQP